ncbi:hypothetical protein EON82_02515 [bacterium]|nr:MAG: hypothetical protein EON82_02515 [bacterium]
MIRFRRPKGPGFGIDAGFYLSVLSTRVPMPTIRQVVNPKGDGGAVVGFGVPLGANEKQALDRPMERGVYAVASKDRKTVLKMRVLSKEEAGFDPEAFLRSPLAAGLDSELLVRLKATWTVAQLTFESHDPDVYPAIDFLLDVAGRLAHLSDGAVADPLSRRYLLPHELRQRVRLDPKVDARETVAVDRRGPAGRESAATHGLMKFGMPEFEIENLLPDEVGLAGRFLVACAQSALLGDPPKSGDRYGAPNALFEAREGGFDPSWQGMPVLELLPPTQLTAGEALRAWEATLRA